MEEEDEIQAQACKLPRLANGRTDPTTSNNNKIAGSSRDGSSSRPHGWHHSSRIIRVSRASGGKDRHSKVMTSKGLRDRRVRLSVTTAIQFYDLQDRLGYDQPSKAVEWLIKSAQDAIAELPSLNNTFPDDTPNDNSPDAPIDNQNQNHNSQNLSLSKSACSSTSETSKGSGLSLSRTDIRVKARERARERAAKEKKKENNNENSVVHEQQHQNINPVSPSFTELLTGGITSAVPTTTTTNSPTSHEPDATLFHKAAAAARQQWASPPMDYFTQVLAAPSSSSSSRTHQHQHQIQLGHHNLAEAISFNNHHHLQQQQQHYSFIPDQFMPSHSHSHHHSGGDSDYNLNFTISPASVSASASSASATGLAAYNNNRGTLQSNSPSHFLPHLQRFSLPMDGSTVPFFIGAASAAPPPPMDNHHHQFSSPAFDARLHLYYADGTRHPDHKGKSKN